MAKFERQSILDVIVVEPQKFGDSRGFFSETYNADVFRQNGVDIDFVQDNQSLSSATGTVRGLHYQLEPFAQAKLVRVLRGSILDVAVDIRRGSPTFGQHVAVELSARAWNQLLIPVGFAHGFCTLEPDTEIAYKCSGFYSRAHERSILWSDPDLGITWPVSPDKAVLSDKDKQAPLFADAVDFF